MATNYVAKTTIHTGHHGKRDALGNITEEATAKVHAPGEAVKGLNDGEIKRLLAMDAIEEAKADGTATKAAAAPAPAPAPAPKA